MAFGNPSHQCCSSFPFDFTVTQASVMKQSVSCFFGLCASGSPQFVFFNSFYLNSLSPPPHTHFLSMLEYMLYLCNLSCSTHGPFHARCPLTGFSSIFAGVRTEQDLYVRLIDSMTKQVREV